jgi:hypothetical protein
VHKDAGGVSIEGEGKAIQQADLTSIDCAVYDLDSATPNVAIATPLALVNITISNTLVDDAIWTLDKLGRNFLHSISGSVFSNPHLYRIIYTATLSIALGSEKIVWVYDHQSVAVTTATPFRTSQDDVRAIIDTDPDLDITPFIEAANSLVDKVEECAIDKGKGLTTRQLHMIETYLSAHLYALKDPQYTSKRTERAAATFQGKTAMGLDSTYWGQMAKIFDTSGCLDAFGSSRATVGITWLGLPPSSQTAYSDRN